jgi:hypothetical protein
MAVFNSCTQQIPPSTSSSSTDTSSIVSISNPVSTPITPALTTVATPVSTLITPALTTVATPVSALITPAITTAATPVTSLTTISPTTAIIITPSTSVPITTTPETIAPTQKLDFNSIKISDIREVFLSSNRINASNNQNNVLTPGTILLYRTNEGKFGKLLILEYGDILKFKYCTYTDSGSIFTLSDSLSAKLGLYYDLDLGQINENNADFWYQNTDSVERYFTPTKGAKFTIYGSPNIIPTPFMPQVKQEIEYGLKKGNDVGSYVSYEKYLVGGENITGLLQIGSDSGDLTKTTWYFQIVNPNGEIERSWMWYYNELYGTIQNELNFNHSILKTGYYKVRILNYGTSALLLYLKIGPYGWENRIDGTSSSSWKLKDNK